jgi:zinc transport system permease protein
MGWRGAVMVMPELLGFAFVQRALIAGMLVSLVASYFGVFVIQRRLSFLGHGLAHAAFGGVALGLLLGAQPLWVALPFTVLVAVAMVCVSDNGALREDAAIGILLSLAMALGVLFMSLRQGYAADAHSFLFGSILAVGAGDLWAAGALLLLTLCAIPLWGRWAYATFDRESARADKLPVRFDDYLLAILLAVTIVVAVKIVGAVLVSAFLIVPAATARLLSARFSTMTLLSMALALLTTLGGLLVSLQTEVPSGAMIVLAQAGVFLAVLLLTSVLRRNTTA